MTDLTVPTSTHIRDVRVYDGVEFTQPRDVFILDGDIAEGGGEHSAPHVVEGSGLFLLPGLLDTHVHLNGVAALRQFATAGVTTVLDMHLMNPELIPELRAAQRVADFRTAVAAAIGPAGPHAQMAGASDDLAISDPALAEQFVADRYERGADYLKIILEPEGKGGPGLDTARALSRAAHARGLKVVAHATAVGSFEMALDAEADFVTHLPMDGPLPLELVQRMAQEGGVSIPTLSILSEFSKVIGDPSILSSAMTAVGDLLEAGVVLLAGTDANETPGIPANPRFGSSLHGELKLLVQAGLSAPQAIAAATYVPAAEFGLHDRGEIAAGKRADLLLISANPLDDIEATARVERVWLLGTEVPL